MPVLNNKKKQKEGCMIFSVMVLTCVCCLKQLYGMYDYVRGKQGEADGG